MCQASEIPTRDICRKCGFRGPYGAYTENVTQIEIDVSRNYSTLHLRKTKYSSVARVQARTTLEINKKILSQGSNLEPNRIIFDKSANYSRSEVFQRVAKLVKSLGKSARYNIKRLSLGYKVKAKRRIRGYRALCTISSISGYILALWVIFGPTLR